MFNEKMKHVEVNIGKICNSRCLFCYDAGVSLEKKIWVAKEKIFKDLECFYKKGFRSVDFVGGEPTIYPYIFEVVKKAKKLGFVRIVMASNAKKFSDFNFTEKIIKAGLNRATLSIHSYKEEIEDHLTTIKGSFEQKIAGVKNLVYFRDRNYLKEGISINPLIHRLNYQRLESLVVFFNRLGIDNFRFNFLRPENKAYRNKKIVVSFTELKPYLARLVDVNEKVFHFYINFGDIPICMYPKNVRRNQYLFKKYFGEGYDFPTSIVTYNRGKFFNKRSEFNWQKRKKDFLKKKLLICKKCFYNKICEGIYINYLRTYGTKEFSKNLLEK